MKERRKRLAAESKRKLSHPNTLGEDLGGSADIEHRACCRKGNRRDINQKMAGRRITGLAGGHGNALGSDGALVYAAGLGNIANRYGACLRPVRSSKLGGCLIPAEIRDVPCAADIRPRRDDCLDDVHATKQ